MFDFKEINKNYQLLDEQGQLRKAWEMTRGKRLMDHREIWDTRRRCKRKTGVVFVPVFDRTYEQPLTLIVLPRFPGTGLRAVPMRSGGRRK